MRAQELFGLVTPGKAANDIFRLCGPESLSLPLNVIRPEMTTLLGGACVLLAVGLGAVGVPAPVAGALEAVDVVVGLDAAGCDELHAATQAMSVKMAAAGMTRLITASLGTGHETRCGKLSTCCCGAAGALRSTDLSCADLMDSAGLRFLIMMVPAIFFPGSWRPTSDPAAPAGITGLAGITPRIWPEQRAPE